MLSVAAIKQHAQSLGIDVIGITTAEPFTRFREQVQRGISIGGISPDNLRYEELLAQYYVTLDPKSSLPEARSVIVLGLRYFLDEPTMAEEASTPRGNIGRMHWRNFFAVLDEKRDALSRFLLENGARVADKPLIPVKAAAHRAGAGVYGKNTIIQHEDFGSWVLYRAIVTDLELPPEEELEPRCGSCQKCLRLCPTRAITEPYRMSPALCLNHVLASPEPIPLALRQAVGNRINSCDLCQEVCPRNSYVPPCTSPPPDEWGEWTKDPLLLALLNLTDTQFQQKFARLDWHVPRLELLKRNALVALGNVGDRRVLPHLLAYAGGDDTMLAEHAAWAIESICRRCPDAEGEENSGAGTAI